MQPSWDEYCVICGGPPRCDSTRCPAGQNQASPVSTDWLRDWLGVTPEFAKQPIVIGQYDSYGCWQTPCSTFAGHCRWASSIAPNQRKHDLLYGPPDECHCPPDVQGDSHDSEACRVVCSAHAPLELHWLKGSGHGDSSRWARYGVAFHRSCAQLLHQRLGYKIDFRHVWPLLEEPTAAAAACRHDPSTRKGRVQSTNHLNCSYGGIDRLHGSHLGGSRFAFRFVAPTEEYMLLDPLQCGANADRIIRTWEPLVQQFKQAAGKGKGSSITPQVPPSSISQSNPCGPGPSTGPGGAASGGRTVAGIGDSCTHRSAAAAAGGASSSCCQLEAASPARTDGRTQLAVQLMSWCLLGKRMLFATAEDTANNVLQLVFSHAGSPRDQVVLAAQLLPLSSTMPLLLAGRMQLAVAANTWPRVQQVASWLHRYGCLVNGLELNAVVDCCEHDNGSANVAVFEAINTTAAKFKGFRLLSLSAHVPDSAGSQLLLSLPPTHLTALHLTGPWALSDAAAAAPTAATALRNLTLSGVGLGEALTAHPAVLPACLQSLRLTDAGACSAATLKTLSDQLSALTHLTLDYNPLGEEQHESPGMVTSPTNSHHSLVEPEVQDCWVGLPALRSLHIGSRKIPQEHGLDTDNELLGDDDDFQEPGQRSYLSVDCPLLKSIAALTGLTSLTLGPSAWLQIDAVEEAPEPWGLLQLRKLTGLQQLVLTLQAWPKPGEGYVLDDEACDELMEAVVKMPRLQDLALSGAVCGLHIRKFKDDATQLTRLESVTSYAAQPYVRDEVLQLDKERPGLMVFPCGRP